MPRSHSGLSGASDGCSPKNPSRSTAPARRRPCVGRGIAMLRAQRVVRRLAVRDDDVQRVGGAALEEADERAPRALPPTDAPRSSSAPNAVRRRKLGLSPIVDERQRAGFHEYSAIHRPLLRVCRRASAPLEFRGADASPTTCASPSSCTGRPSARLPRAEPPSHGLLHRRHLIVVVRLGHRRRRALDPARRASRRAGSPR